MLPSSLLLKLPFLPSRNASDHRLVVVSKIGQRCPCVVVDTVFVVVVAVVMVVKSPLVFVVVVAVVIIVK